MKEMSSTKPTLMMIEKHRPAIQVGLRHPILTTNQSQSPTQGLDHGGCVLHEQLDNRPNLRHIVPEEPGMTHSG